MLRNPCHIFAPRNAAWTLISVLAVAAVPGCGQKAPYSCIRVSGKVVYEDGSLIPADQVHVIFLSLTPPTTPKTPPKNGIADANGKTGVFDFATTYLYRDGIVAGEHKVIVQCIRNGLQARELVAPEFSDPVKTPLKVRSSESPFVIKVRKPR
jgi:hypothetical protein